jgi:hypothetical protein
VRILAQCRVVAAGGHTRPRAGVRGTDRVLRVTEKLGRHLSQLPDAILVHALENPTKTKPREPIPRIPVGVTRVFRSLTPRALAYLADIVRPIVVVQDIDASLVPEVGEAERRGPLTPAAQQSVAVLTTLTAIPFDSPLSQKSP